MLIKDLRNLKFIEPMLREAEFFLASERYMGEKVIKFISASPYAARALHQMLRRWKREGRISFFIPGVKFSVQHADTKYFLDRFPDRLQDEDLEQGNPLITLVCLYV